MLTLQETPQETTPVPEQVQEKIMQFLSLTSNVWISQSEEKLSETESQLKALTKAKKPLPYWASANCLVISEESFYPFDVEHQIRKLERQVVQECIALGNNLKGQTSVFILLGVSVIGRYLNEKPASYPATLELKQLCDRSINLTRIIGATQNPTILKALMAEYRPLLEKVKLALVEARRELLPKLLQLVLEIYLEKIQLNKTSSFKITATKLIRAAAKLAVEWQLGAEELTVNFDDFKSGLEADNTGIQNFFLMRAEKEMDGASISEALAILLKTAGTLTFNSDRPDEAPAFSLNIAPGKNPRDFLSLLIERTAIYIKDIDQHGKKQKLQIIQGEFQHLRADLTELRQSIGTMVDQLRVESTLLRRSIGGADLPQRSPHFRLHGVAESVALPTLNTPVGTPTSVRTTTIAAMPCKAADSEADETSEEMSALRLQLEQEAKKTANLLVRLEQAELSLRKHESDRQRLVLESENGRAWEEQHDVIVGQFVQLELQYDDAVQKLQLISAERDQLAATLEKLEEQLKRAKTKTPALYSPTLIFAFSPNKPNQHSVPFSQLSNEARFSRGEGRSLFSKSLPIGGFYPGDETGESRKLTLGLRKNPLLNLLSGS